MASSSSMRICPVLFLLLLAANMASATSNTHPSQAKCMHHHAQLTTCARYLQDDVIVPLPTEACCRNYDEIFRTGTPTCLCRYLHPEKLRTSFNVTKIMSLHDICQSSSSSTVPLYDLCVGLQDPQEKFDGILEVVNSINNQEVRRHGDPSNQA